MKRGYILFEENLNEEYKKVFEQIDMYCSAILIDEDTSDEMMMELLDHMLESQNAGKPVTNVVGEDVDAFCKNFFSEYKMSDRFFNVMKVMYRCAWIMFVYSVFDFLLAEDKSEMLLRDDIGPIVIGLTCGALVGPLVYTLIRPFVTKYKKMKVSVFNVLMTVIMIGSIVLAGVLSTKYSVYIPGWAAILISGLYIVIYVVVRMVLNYKRYGSVKKPKQVTIGFWDSVWDNLENDMPKEWCKQFNKKNEKRKKRGKPLMTEEQFMYKLDKQYDYKRNRIIDGVVMLGISIGFIILTAIVGGFESNMDFIIFVMILVVIDSGCYWGLNAMQKKTCWIYMQMRDKMKTEDLTLEEYATISKK